MASHFHQLKNRDKGDVADGGKRGRSIKFQSEERN